MADAKGQTVPRRASARAKAHKPIPAPDDFDSEADFLTFVRKLYSDDWDADKANRDAAIEDAEFLAGKQWADDIRQRRELKRKPVLTINRTVAFVGQIVGTRRMNDTQIRVLPEHGGTRKIAEVRQGLIRNCEKKSKADRAYDTALQNCVVGGLGNFGVQLEFARYDVFEQDINFIEYPDAFSVVWDRLSVDKTGRDANHVFIVDTMSRTAFDDKYPWAQPSEFVDDTASHIQGWFESDDVRVVEFWRMRYDDCELALLTDGRTVDITEWAEDDPRRSDIVLHPHTGAAYTRETVKPCAEKYILSGTEILEGPYRIPISRLPVVRVPAWEITINGRRHRWGLIRFLKDPQRLHNYWRTTIAEKLMMAPRARWVASDAAVAGREGQWRNAHLSDDPLLIWNGESGQAPEYTPPAQIEVALVQEANMSVQDLRDVSNLHEASLGQQSNEVSGKAIMARQRVGDVGTALYHDNVNAGIGEGGEIANELIDVAFDAPRIARVIGSDDKESFQAINDPENPDSVDVCVGRYSVAVTTGPSTATKRVEAQEAMIAIFNAAPEVLSQAADLWAEQLDFPGAEKLAKRLRKLLPPNLIDPDDLSESERAQYEEASQQASQAQAAQQQIQMQMIAAELAEKQALARKAVAEAAKAEAEAQLAVAKTRAEHERPGLLQAQADAAQASAAKTLAEANEIGHADDEAREAESIGNDMFSDDDLKPEDKTGKN